MSYEFTRFYPAVCKGLGVDPSEASEALYWAIVREFNRLSVDGVLSGSFVSSVHDAVDAISADEQFVTRIDRIEDVRDGDYVTVTLQVFKDEDIWFVEDRLNDEVVFHYATRRGFDASA